MKNKIYQCFLLILALILCIVFGRILLIYTKPMEDVSLDLSLALEDNADPADFDNKGWTVYTQSEDEITILESNGFGAYLGLEPGQTFYYSRTLNEQLDSPTLQLSAINQKFSVWLNDTLIYTDCPDLDNQIGYVTLPMNEWDRNEQIIISLPLDYYGKTLTIAQSSPKYADANYTQAFPTRVMLYCGFSYESKLISESFTTAILASGAFFIGVILLILMVFHNDLSLLFLSLIPFSWIMSFILNTSFFFTYFENHYNTLSGNLSLIPAAGLFVFLALRSNKYRLFPFGIAFTYIAALLTQNSLFLHNDFFAATDFTTIFFATSLPEWIAFTGILGMLALAILFWRKQSAFYQIFSWIAPSFLVIFWTAILIKDFDHVCSQVLLNLKSHSITYVYHKILWPIIGATLLTALIDAWKTAVLRRSEKQLLAEKQKLTLESYENLRRQHEEVMMIRHDMTKHFHVLNDMSEEIQIKSYLKDLIGQNQAIRSVIQTGNQMLDIILNSKLSTAADHGIKVDIVNVSAPSVLPLSDADLCSLIVNMMDNALSGATQSNSEEPFIRLDIHEKNNYFAITCENTASIVKDKKNTKKETVQKHGFGLKIIQQIIKRYHGLLDTEYDNNVYKLKIVLPLS